MSIVAVVPAGEDLGGAIEEVFAPFGGVKTVLGGKEDVFIKVNAVDFKAHCFTDPAFVSAAIKVFKRAGAKNVYVIENSTQGNFTRLVFRVSGLEKATKDAGGKPIYLDEGKQVEVILPTLGYPVHVSRWVKDRLIDGRDRSFYLSIPKLKTHSMGTVTLGVKNQYGLIMQGDRSRDHNWKLHRKFADIYSLVRPDFTLIEGIHATNHGHHIPDGLQDQCVERLGVLIGGDDTLAVDAVGADIMGIDPSEVEHLRLAAEDGMGTIALDEIEVVGDREPFRRSFSSEILPVFPPDVRIIEGSERCCKEGCNLNTRMTLQMFYVDFEGQGDFTICMGKGLDPEEIEKLDGRVLLAGDCAIEEAYPILSRRLDRKSLRVAEGCNQLRDVLSALTVFMKVDTLKLVPLPPWESLWLLLVSRLKGTTALTPPIIPR
jgi:uncharacterized protein (DUF362 family)